VTSRPEILALRSVFVALVHADGRDPTLRQLGVLLLVARPEGPRTVRGFSQALNMQGSTVVRAADRLEELGFVLRVPDPSDKHGVLLTLTDKGVAVLGRVYRAGADR
jgi:DNA-binding MarR family transcriptional regulator